jgi:N-methylhydantoinase A
MKALLTRPIFDPRRGRFVDTAVLRRETLGPGDVIEGPAAIAEDQTTTLVPEGFVAFVNAGGYIVLERSRAEPAT